MKLTNNFRSLNAKLETLTPKQSEYLSLSADGPYKPDMYEIALPLMNSLTCTNPALATATKLCKNKSRGDLIPAETYFVLNGISYGLSFLHKNKKHQISFSFYLMGFFYFLTVYARGWGVLGLQQLPVK